LFFVVFAFCLYKNKQIVDFLFNFLFNFILQKKDGINLFTSTISAAFFFKLKVVFYLSIAICIPFFVYNFYAFVSLGLFFREKKLLLFLSSFGVLLGYFGFFLSVFYLLPLCILFFNSMQLSVFNVKELVDLDSFFYLCFNIGLCGFFTFQTPIAIFLLLK
jgi:sec-independent protein translocase protein TatC